ncbi:MAG: conserved rane protein of unknown function [Modestobacter sp.]|nr:conserved rane protein of unknown function [Modestobacter sp.]MCW2676145.1 conserved rane protein of unknown function [Modestobacter sp.]
MCRGSPPRARVDRASGRNLAAVAAQDGGAKGGRRSRPRAEVLLGGTAEPTRPRVERSTERAPRAVRRAALVVAVEAALLLCLAVVILVLTVVSSPDSVGRAVAEAFYVLAGGLLLAGAAAGLWRVAAWSRGPVIVLQVLLGVVGYSFAFPGERPLIGLPVLALAAVEIYLLLTPEARLAFAERQPPS